IASRIYEKVPDQLFSSPGCLAPGGFARNRELRNRQRPLRYNRINMIRFSTAGESHGEALIALLSGMPAGVPIDLDFVNRELWRRQQGYGRGGRMKIETDKVHVLSGVRH